MSKRKMRASKRKMRAFQAEETSAKVLRQEGRSSVSSSSNLPVAKILRHSWLCSTPPHIQSLSKLLVWPSQSPRTHPLSPPRPGAVTSHLCECHSLPISTLEPPPPSQSLYLLHSSCCGWTLSPSKSMWRSPSSPPPRDVTVFGDKVLKVVGGVKWGPEGGL